MESAWDPVYGIPRISGTFISAFIAVYDKKRRIFIIVDARADYLVPVVRYRLTYLFILYIKSKSASSVLKVKYYLLLFGTTGNIEGREGRGGETGSRRKLRYDNE